MMLIVIEGIDGSGKTTQAKLLFNALKRMGYDAILLTEPSNSEYGVAIRNKLKSGNYTPQELYELFVKDRKTHVEDIQTFLNEKKVVIMDRYYMSTIAYQGSQGIAIERIISDHKDLPQPDIVIILDIDPTTALGRLGKNRDSFEKVSFLENVRQAYLNLPKILKKVLPGTKIYIIKANAPIDLIHKQILDIVLKHLQKINH